MNHVTLYDKPNVHIQQRVRTTNPATSLDWAATHYQPRRQPKGKDTKR